MKKFAMLFAMVFAGILAADAPKYVFLFIGDGMSVPQRMVAEEYAIKTGKGKLVMNHLSSHATTRTSSATSLVTDSAASGTAIACGVKTYNGAIGVDVNKKKVESMAEAAKKAGRKVGIITTVTLTHATPAVFYSHRESRSLYYQIALDMVNSGFEYFAGGGLNGKHNDKKDKEYCGNIFDLAAEKGYKVVTDAEEFRKLRPSDGKVLYTVDKKSAMEYSIDSDGKEPTVAELTAKGIEMLDNPKGFFMMVEGGKIDYAGHGNDAATNIKDLIALNDAVEVAMKFAKKHDDDDVLIIVTGDHETGGMTMGVAGTGYALHIDRFQNQKCSISKFDSILRNEKRRIKKEKDRDMEYSDAVPLLEKWFGFVFEGDATDDQAAGDKFAKKGAGTTGNPMVLNKKEKEMLEEGFKKGKLHDAARQVINNKSGVGWTTGAHTALPVLTTSYGEESDEFVGFLDNTDIGRKVKELYHDDDGDDD